MTAEHGRADALMAAITGEPLSDEDRADAAFMAEHRSAAADVAALRERLGIIGDALAGPPAAAAAPRPVRPPARARRRTRTAVLGTLAAAAAASVLAGMGWLMAQTGGGAADSGSAVADQKSAESAGTAFGSPRYLACARLVAEGTVSAVEEVAGTASVRVTLRTTRVYRPAGGERDLTYVIGADVVPGLRAGDRVLIGVPRDARVPDHWAVGEADIAPERAGLAASLAEARRLGCP